MKIYGKSGNIAGSLLSIIIYVVPGHQLLAVEKMGCYFTGLNKTLWMLQ